MDMKHSCLAVGFAAVVLLLSVRTASGQTQGQLEQHYPKLNAFLPKPNVIVTVKYSPSGDVCEMVLEPRHWDGKGFLLNPALAESDVLSVVEEIVPLNERGERVKSVLADLAIFSGQGFSQTYTYQRMAIEVAGVTKPFGIVSARVTWPNRSCGE